MQALLAVARATPINSHPNKPAGMPALCPVRPTSQLAAKFAPSPVYLRAGKYRFQFGRDGEQLKVHGVRWPPAGLTSRSNGRSEPVPRPSLFANRVDNNWYLEHALQLLHRCRNLLRHARAAQTCRGHSFPRLSAGYTARMARARHPPLFPVPFHRSCLPHRVRRAQADGAPVFSAKPATGRGAPTRMPSWPQALQAKAAIQKPWPNERPTR